MFTAIQTKFQKHYKVLFFIMLVVVIVAFVFTIGAAPGIGGEGRAPERDFFGYNLASERDARHLMRAGELSFRMEHASLEGVRSEDLQGYAIERIAFLGLADQLRIPGPTEEDLMNFVFTRAAFQDPSGAFDRRRYARFTDEIEADPQRSAGEVVRVLEEDFRIAGVRRLTGGPGYIQPAEVRRELERNQTLWSVELATYDLTAFEPEVEVTDEAVREFFEANPRRYEREAQTVFSYVEFDPETFLDRVEDPSEQELLAYFQRNRDRFQRPEESAGEAGDTEESETEPEEERETTLDDVRDQVLEAMRGERARRLAHHAASDFTYALFDQGVQPDSETFPALIDEFGGSLHDAPPASPTRFPAELGFPWDVQQEVFRLTDRRFFSDPKRVNDRFLVFIYRDTIDAYVPPLDDVRERVVQDFELQEERRLLSEVGTGIRQRLQEHLNEGQSFEEAAGAEGLDFLTIDSFSRIAPPNNMPPPVVQRLDEFRTDRVSSMIRAQNYGFFARLKEKQVPEIDPTSGEFRRTAYERSSTVTQIVPRGVISEFMSRRLEGSE